MKLPPNELSPKIVLIYALLLLKCRESYLCAFLIHNFNFARLFARLTPVFLLKKPPSFARLFTKMSPSEELVTLDWGSRELHRINSVGRTMQRLRCREGVRDVRWQDGWGNVARSPQWRSPDRNVLGHVEEEWAEVQQWEGNNSRAQEQQNNPRREDLSIEVMSPEYLEQSEAFGDITRSPQSPEWHADDSPASPEPWQRSPSPARSRSPSPGEGPSHSRWPPRLSVRDP